MQGELSSAPSQIVHTCKVTGMLFPSVCFGERIRPTPCWFLSPVGSVVWSSTRKLGRNWICQHMCFPLRACYCACARKGRNTCLWSSLGQKALTEVCDLIPPVTSVFLTVSFSMCSKVITLTAWRSCTVSVSSPNSWRRRRGCRVGKESLWLLRCFCNSSLFKYHIIIIYV